jgi:hypothetical protein
MGNLQHYPSCAIINLLEWRGLDCHSAQLFALSVVIEEREKGGGHPGAPYLEMMSSGQILQFNQTQI